MPFSDNLQDFDPFAWPLGGSLSPNNNCFTSSPTAQYLNISGKSMAEGLFPRDDLPENVFWDEFTYLYSPSTMLSDGSSSSNSQATTPEIPPANVHSQQSNDADNKHYFPQLDQQISSLKKPVSPVEPMEQGAKRRCGRRRASEDSEYSPIATSPSPFNQSWRPSTQKRHSVIEQRYRTTICFRINELKKCLPSLCHTAERSSKGTNSITGQSSAQRAAAGPGVTKATVLETATAYIKDIQCQYSQMRTEAEEWKARSQMLEKLVLGQSTSIHE